MDLAAQKRIVKENYASNASMVDTCFRQCVDDFTSKLLTGKEERCLSRCAEKFLKFTLRVDYAAAVYAKTQELFPSQNGGGGAANATAQ
ncbi:hypothetical protein DFJ73DRAFT_843927 [Zopfochytrium polystomum]|nr:hypothetical protein DFJ73DRAFT_843927 [Zopfochytrium polystomum]